MTRRSLLIICLLSPLVSSQISFGGPPPEKEVNKCTTPDGKDGECIGLRSCNNILVLLRKPIATEAIKYLRASVCSFSGFLPDVCCPPEPVTFGISTTTTSTSTTTTTTTTTITTTTTTTTTKTTAAPIIDGNWSDWGPWGSCSKTCDGGTQNRNRFHRLCMHGICYTFSLLEPATLPLPLPMVEPPVRERTRTRGSVERR